MLGTPWIANSRTFPGVFILSVAATLKMMDEAREKKAVHNGAGFALILLIFVEE